MLQERHCLPWGPLKGSGRSGPQVRRFEGLWEIAEAGGPGKGEREERRIEVMREESSKRWGVIAGLCLNLKLVLGTAGTSVELNGV